MAGSNDDKLEAAKAHAIFLDRISQSLVQLDKEWEPASEKFLQLLDKGITPLVQVRDVLPATTSPEPLMSERLRSLFGGLREAIHQYKKSP